MVARDLPGKMPGKRPLSAVGAGHAEWPMEHPDPNPQRNRSSSGDLAWPVVALLVLMLCMAVTIYYPYPSGRPMSLAGFVAFWLREIVLLAIVVIPLVFVAVVWVWRRLRGLFGRVDCGAS
jgi:hypothetical protein